MNITLQQLADAVQCRMWVARAWRDPINAACDRFGIATPLRMAAFLAQIGHESNGLTRVRENLNYTPTALIATFGKRITPEQAELYGRTAAHPADQRMIANIAYANRIGNGPVASNDGWNYRGGGPGQLTGRHNYTVCGTAIGIDLANHHELIERPEIGALAFGWFWHEGSGKDLNVLADRHDIVGISRSINGGDNGLQDRIQRYQLACRVLGVEP